MPNDGLEQLLRKADATFAASPADSQHLAVVARNIHRRHVWRGRMLRGVAIVALCCLLIPSLTHRRTSTSVIRIPLESPPPPHFADRQTLQQQQAAEEQCITMMLAAEKRDASEQAYTRMPKLNLTQQFEEEREQSALVVLQGTARLSGEAEVASVYHRVIDLFPGTGAAAVAQQQIDQIH